LGNFEIRFLFCTSLTTVKRKMFHIFDEILFTKAHYFIVMQEV